MIAGYSVTMTWYEPRKVFVVTFMEEKENGYVETEAHSFNDDLTFRKHAKENIFVFADIIPWTKIKKGHVSRWDSE